MGKNKMGVGDYIIPYTTDDERDKINSVIEEYKREYASVCMQKENLSKFLIIFNQKYDSEASYEELNALCDRIVLDNPDIDFSGINVYEQCLECECNDDYQLCFDLLIDIHQRLEFKDEKGKVQKAIRVFFHMGQTSTFFNHLTKSGIKDKNIYWNSYWRYDYEVVEEYPCILKDSLGNDLPEYL